MLGDSALNNVLIAPPEDGEGEGVAQKEEREGRFVLSPSPLSLRPCSSQLLHRVVLFGEWCQQRQTIL